MCEPTTAMMGASLAMQAYGTYYGAKSAKEGGEASQRYYEHLAGISEKQADAVTAAAEKEQEFVQDQAMRESKAIKARGRQVSASQRAAMAANGLALDSATAEDVIRDSFSQEQLDDMAIRHSADLRNWEINNQAKFKSWDLKSQASSYRMAGRAAAKAGNVNATSTVLGGAAAIGSSWANWNKTT